MLASTKLANKSPQEKMDINNYLTRIDIDETFEPNLENLKRLQTAHMLHVPFENLNIHWGIPIELDEESLYQKIVVGNRGGFCYELNGLFAWLLRELGFQVDQLSCGVYSTKNKSFGPEYDHMTLLVHLEEDYLVDVGFGDSYRMPIKMPDGEVEDVSGRYRVIQNSDGKHLLQRQIKGDWEPQYRFTLIPRNLDEYTQRCSYHQTSPDSHFTQQKIISIAKPWGRLSLSESALITTKSTTRINENVESEADWNSKLQEIFGIRVEKQ